MFKKTPNLNCDFTPKYPKLTKKLELKRNRIRTKKLSDIRRFL